MLTEKSSINMMGRRVNANNDLFKRLKSQTKSTAFLLKGTNLI